MELTDNQALNRMKDMQQILYNDPLSTYKDQGYNNIRWYIHCHENNQIVLYFRQMFSDYIKNQFINSNFNKSLKIDDKLYYYKKQEMFKNYIFNYDNSHVLFLLYGLFDEFNNIGGIYNEETIRTIDIFLQKYSNYKIDKEILNSMIDFNNSNIGLIHYNMQKLEYGNKYELLVELRSLIENKITNDYLIYRDKNFDSYKSQTDPNYNCYNEYKAKIIGNYGELLMFDVMKNEMNAEHTALLSNDFHYDAYYQTLLSNKIIENIREIKSTLNSPTKLDDTFSISNYEYNIMLESLERDNTNYGLLRFFIDTKANNNLYLLLNYNKINTSFINNQYDIRYELTSEDEKKKYYTRKK